MGVDLNQLLQSMLVWRHSKSFGHIENYCCRALIELGRWFRNAKHMLHGFENDMKNQVDTQHGVCAHKEQPASGICEGAVK